MDYDVELRFRRGGRRYEVHVTEMDRACCSSARHGRQWLDHGRRPRSLTLRVVILLLSFTLAFFVLAWLFLGWPYDVDQQFWRS